MLFQSTTELKNYISVDAVTRFDSLKPYIDEAELLFIRDLLGDAMYSTLSSDYSDNDGTPSNGANAALLPYVQRSLAYYASFLSVDQMSVNFGDAGITQTRTETVEPAPKHKTDALKMNFITSGDLHAEVMLSYLERTASPSVLNDWYSSASNTIAEGRILRTAKQASHYIDINENRRIFRKMRSQIREVEEGMISQLIGDPLYQEIVLQIKTDTLKDNLANLLLVQKLEPVIAKKALLETLPSIRISITDQGITVFSSNDDVVKKAAATDAQVKALRDQLSKGDHGYVKSMDKAEKFLLDFADNYPLYKESGAYTSRPQPGPRRPPKNDVNKKYVSV